MRPKKETILMDIGLEGFHAFLRWTSWQLVAWWAGNKLSSSSSGSCSQEAEKGSGTLREGSRQACPDEETAESQALCLTANLHSSLRLSSGSGIQATEMSLLRRVSGLSLRDGRGTQRSKRRSKQSRYFTLRGANWDAVGNWLGCLPGRCFVLWVVLVER